MKKIIVLTLICLITAVSLPVLAGEKILEKDPPFHDDNKTTYDININFNRPYHNHHHFIVDWYKYQHNHAFGLKFQMIPDYYATFNCEFENMENDLLLSVGAQYRIPKEIILWHFYLGGEYTFSRNDLSGTPYIIFGTDFLFFFGETKLPLTQIGNPESRGGFRINF